MIKTLAAFVIILCFGATLATAQTTRDCTTVPGCIVITDAFPLTGPQPQQCKLFEGPVLLTQTPVVPGTTDNPGAPAGSVACRFASIILAAGLHTLTAVSVASGYADSIASPPLSISSQPGPLPTPTNLRPK